MGNLKCPNCGAPLDIVRPALTFRQRRIRKFVREISRERGRPARTAEIMALLAVSMRTVQYELALLEALGEIHRPNGKKSGWAIETTPQIVLTRELA